MFEFWRSMMYRLMCYMTALQANKSTAIRLHWPSLSSQNVRSTGSDFLCRAVCARMTLCLVVDSVVEAAASISRREIAAARPGRCCFDVRLFVCSYRSACCGAGPVRFHTRFRRRVQVALKLQASGKNVNAGMQVPYVICKGIRRRAMTRRANDDVCSNRRMLRCRRRRGAAACISSCERISIVFHCFYRNALLMK